MGIMTKRSKYILVALSFICLGAGPSQPPVASTTSETAPKTATQITLAPVQVVYRQVEGTYLKSPRGVWVDKAKKEVIVADTMNDLVAVYDAKGLPLFAFGYNQELKEPVKAVADPAGRIYVLNGIPRAVKVFSYRGEYLNDFPLTGTDKKPNPTALAADDKGNIYVADDAGGQIQVYDNAFRLVREFGKKTDGSSYLKNVQAIAVDGDGDIYVADASAIPAIQVFSSDGKFLRGWGAHDAGPHNFSLPAGLTIDGEGRVIVVDSMRHAITVFTREGNYLSRHGGMGRQAGAVLYPTDIASDGSEKIYVVERLGSRLQVLEEQSPAARRNAKAPSSPNPVRSQVRSALGDVMKGMK